MVVPNIFYGSYNGLNNQSIDLRLSYISFGFGVNILAASGEMLGEWLPLIDSLIPAHTLVTGYLGGQCLYVPPSSVIPDGGYEVDGFQKYFGMNGAFCPDISEKVINTIMKLVSEKC